MSAVTLKVLLGALRMVERVQFCDATFTTDQVTSILSMLNEGSQGKLKKLGIFWPQVEEEGYDLLEAAAAEKNDILDVYV